MNVPNNLLYSKEHEWVRVEGNKAYVGITDYAQHSLGDIVFVELPETDTTVTAMSEAGVVESVKAVSPIFCPVTGTIIEVNDHLEGAPELLNNAPYDEHIFVVEMSSADSTSQLIDADAYEQLCNSESAN